MELWIAIVGLVGVLGAAFVSRWPAMTADGRLRESIARDAALWAALPPGRGRDEFAEHIAERAQKLREKRAEVGDLGERALVAATSLFGIAYLLLAGAAALSSDEEWTTTFALPGLLLSFGIAAAVLAAVSVVAALAVWTIAGVRNGWRWWVRRRDRRTPPVRE